MVSHEQSGFEDLEVDGGLTFRGIMDTLTISGSGVSPTFTGSTFMGSCSLNSFIVADC